MLVNVNREKSKKTPVPRKFIACVKSCVKRMFGFGECSDRECATEPMKPLLAWLKKDLYKVW